MEPFDLGPMARHLSDLVSGVGDAEHGAATPCPAYQVADLLEHLGTMAQAFTAAARKQPGPLTEQQPAGDAARLPADWRSVIPRDLRAVATAWADPAAWSGLTRIAGSDAPAEIIGLSLADELVVHGWDLARATGQPFQPDPAAVRAARSFLDQFASPDAPAGPEVPFGPSRPLRDDACSLDRVIALAGRDPGWPAG